MHVDRFVRSAFAALVAFSLCVDAFAQTGEQLATRRNFLQQAQVASGAGDHARALDLAQRAASIHQTASLRLFIAGEEQALGRFAAALGDADQCAIDAEHETSPNRDQIVTQCQQLSRGLHAHVAQLVVHVPDPAPASMRVTVGGEPLDPVAYGAPSIVSAGSVTVEATAPGRVSFHAQTQVAAGGTGDVTVLLPAAPAASTTTISTSPTSSAPASVAPALAPAVATSSAPSSQPSPGFFTPLRIAGVAAFVVGAAVAGIGGGLYAGTSSTYDMCLADPSSSSACAPANQPRGVDTAGSVMIWSGAGVAVLGVAAFVVAGFIHGSEPSVTAWVDPHGVAGIAGRF